MERELTLVVRMIATQAQAASKAMETSFTRLGKTADAAVNQLKRFGSGLVSLGRTIAKAAVSMKALIGALALLLGLQKVIGFFSDLNRELDQLGKVADRMGLTTAQLASLQVGAELAGSSAEELNMALGQLQRRAAQEGDFRNLYDILGDVADRMRAASTEGEKLRISTESFGEELGGRMILLLRDGRDSLAQFSAEAERLGVAFDGRAVQGAAMLGDELFRLRSAFKGLLAEVARELTPGMIASFEVITNFVTENRGKIAQFIASVIKGLATLIASIADVILQLVRMDWDQLKKTVDALLSYFSLRLERWALNTSMKMLNKFVEVFGNPKIFGKELFNMDVARTNFATSLSTLNGLIEDTDASLQAFFTEARENGFTADLIRRIDEVNRILDEMNAELRETGREMGGLEKTIVDVVKGAKEGFREIAKEMRDVAGATAGAFQSAFSGARGAMVGFFEDLYSGTLKAEDAFKKFFQALIQQIISLAAELTVIVILGILINALLPGIGAALGGVGGALGAASGVANAMGTSAQAPTLNSGGAPVQGVTSPSTPGSGGGGFLIKDPSAPNPITTPIVRPNSDVAPRAMMDTGSVGNKGGGMTVINISAMDSESFAGFVSKPENAKALRAQQNQNNVLRDSTRGSLR